VEKLTSSFAAIGDGHAVPDVEARFGLQINEAVAVVLR
jgi:hypothetical protein